MPTLLEAQNTSNDIRRVSFHKAQKQSTSLHKTPTLTAQSDLCNSRTAEKGASTNMASSPSDSTGHKSSKLSY